MTLNVADISRYQAGIDLNRLRAGGCHAVIVGATFGCAGINPAALQQLDGVRAAGMYRGVYHIRARGNWTPRQEADYFLTHLGGYIDGRTLLALDWEECDTSDEGWALEWLQYVEARTGIKPWFYVNLGDLVTYRYPRIAANGNAIWLAQYPYNTVQGFAGVTWAHQPIPAGHTLAAWQYVGTGGNVNGITGLDLSVAYIDGAGWAAYSSPHATAEAATTTPIEQDWFDMATQADLETVMAETLTKWATSPNGQKYIRQAVWAEPGGVRGGRQVTVWRDLTDTNTLVRNLATALQQLPAHILNEPFKTSTGATTNLAGILDQINRKPAGTGIGSTAPALDVDALVNRLATELPPALRADLKSKL